MVPPAASCVIVSLLFLSVSEHFQAPKLIALQDLIAFEQRHQHHTMRSTSCGQDLAEPIQLLKTDVEPFELKDVQNNRKRQVKLLKVAFHFERLTGNPIPSSFETWGFQLK